MHEFKKGTLNGKVTILLEPEELAEYDYWQYGPGLYACSCWRIIGPTAFHVKTNRDALVALCHIVIDVSSQWVLGRNFYK